ncbi:MAG: hypothetical protein J5802_04860 [Butyrivibrio sp.]|nr:hypothetical protein [Butyrivibrio sp.]
MRENEIKLANVKKSCNVAGKVAKVLSIVMIVVAVVLVACGIFMFAFKGEINKNMKVEEVSGEMIAHLYNENGTEICSFNEFEDMGRHSIIGAFNVMEVLVHKGMVAESMGVVFFATAVSLAILAGIFILIMNVFKMIENSDTPFDEAVMKKLKTAFIVFAVYILFSVGLGTAVLAGVVFWSIYCILDYGYVLQKESDETL